MPHTCAEEYNDGNCGQGFVTSPILAIPEGTVPHGSDLGMQSSQQLPGA